MSVKSSLYPIRMRFARDIVAEILLPEKQTGKVAIFCTGVPSLPPSKERLEFFADRGYVSVAIRYRGTWESDGFFLEKSPAQDVRDVILELEKKKRIIDCFSGEKTLIRVSAIHLFGSSFGGPAVLMNTDLPIVTKVIAVSPVIDFSVEGEGEPFHEFVSFSREGFGGAYRLKHAKDWRKLIETDFYNPVAHTKDIDGRKVLMIHAKDDTNVPCGPVVPFAEKTGATYYLKPHGGHAIRMTHQFLWKKIEAFLEKK